MQFVNIIVHSVEDMNFRVHLQYEFTTLGLDQYLESLRHTESEELKVKNKQFSFVLIKTSDIFRYKFWHTWTMCSMCMP